MFISDIKKPLQSLYLQIAAIQWVVPINCKGIEDLMATILIKSMNNNNMVVDSLL